MKRKISENKITSKSKNKKNSFQMSFYNEFNNLNEEEKQSNKITKLKSKNFKCSINKIETRSRSSQRINSDSKNKLEKSILSRKKFLSSFREKVNKKFKSKTKKKNQSEENENSVNSEDSEQSFDSSDSQPDATHLNNKILFVSNLPNISQKKEKSPTKIQIDKEFPYDHSLLKQLDIELKFEFKERIKDFENFIYLMVEKINKYFEANNLEYYEFSNPRGRNISINSQIDNLNYDFLYEKNISFNIAGVNTEHNKNLKIIKNINYLTAMSSVFQSYISKTFDDNESDSFFYLITPLNSFYYFKYEDNFLFKNSKSEIKESGVLISNIHKAFEKNLKEYGIKFEIIPIRKDNENDNSNIPQTGETGMENMTQASDDPIYVCNYYKILLFNYFLNEYDESSFNIYAPFSFEYSTYRQCKVRIELGPKKEKSFSVNLKIFGCLFQTYLSKLINFLSDYDFIEAEFKNKINYSFNLKFHHFMKTGSFFIMNKKLNNVVDKISYQDEYYKIYFKS